MQNDLYPDDLLVTEQDFKNSGWENALLSARHKGYVSMWHALSNAARQATDEGNKSRGKALWLLSGACSMMLRPDSVNEPFKPLSVIDGSRSALPEDLSESNIAFYRKVANAIDEPWLKARLSDLVWLTERDYQFALKAIDAYRSIPLDEETWVLDGRECWTRAIQLTRLLRAGAGDRITHIEGAILAAFKTATKQDRFFALGLSDLLFSQKLGGIQCKVIAQKLESLAGQFDDDGNLYSSREYFNAAAKWFHAARNREKAIAMKVRMAEGFVKEAEARILSANPSHMAAAKFYKDAVQIYQKIHPAERAPHRVDDRLDELRARMSDADKKSLGEMIHVSAPLIDISDTAENARKNISGKTAIEALKIFCNYSRNFDYKDAREYAVKQLRKYPLQSIFTEIGKGRDGRTVSKRPGTNLNDMSSEGNEPAIMSKMAELYKCDIGLRVHGEILPALDVLWSEHHLREHDFVDLAAQSPAVPQDRARLFGKALFAGYDRDFITALHLLVPQIENLVRDYLKWSGVETTTLDDNDIQKEVSLSRLMDMPKVEEIFGASICYEIRALFCDSFGLNLRNNLAHGLLEVDECQDAPSVYTWWFGLRMVFNPFWNAMHKAAPNDGGEEQKE